MSILAKASKLKSLADQLVGSDSDDDRRSSAYQVKPQKKKAYNGGPVSKKDQTEEEHKIDSKLNASQYKKKKEALADEIEKERLDSLNIVSNTSNPKQQQLENADSDEEDSRTSNITRRSSTLNKIIPDNNDTNNKDLFYLGARIGDVLQEVKRKEQKDLEFRARKKARRDEKKKETAKNLELSKIADESKLMEDTSDVTERNIVESEYVDDIVEIPDSDIKDDENKKDTEEKNKSATQTMEVPAPVETLPEPVVKVEHKNEYNVPKSAYRSTPTHINNANKPKNISSHQPNQPLKYIINRNAEDSDDDYKLPISHPSSRSSNHIYQRGEQDQSTYKKKKIRSKQKNLRKDTRPVELRPNGSLYVQK